MLHSLLTLKTDTMKLLVLISALLIASISNGQSPFKKQYDSLSKIAKKEILGYSTTYRNNTLTTTIWTPNFYDYYQEITLNVKTIDSTVVKHAYDLIAKKTGKWVTGYTQTYFKRRETLIIYYLAESGEERYDVVYTVER
jgi:hypothetical protein